jgi:hypothetical protein
VTKSGKSKIDEVSQTNKQKEAQGSCQQVQESAAPAISRCHVLTPEENLRGWGIMLIQWIITLVVISVLLRLLAISIISGCTAIVNIIFYVLTGSTHQRYIITRSDDVVVSDGEENVVQMSTCFEMFAVTFAVVYRILCKRWPLLKRYLSRRVSQLLNAGDDQEFDVEVGHCYQRLWKCKADAPKFDYTVNFAYLESMSLLSNAYSAGKLRSFVYIKVTGVNLMHVEFNEKPGYEKVYISDLLDVLGGRRTEIGRLTDCQLFLCDVGLDPVWFNPFCVLMVFVYIINFCIKAFIFATR